VPAAVRRDLKGHFIEVLFHPAERPRPSYPKESRGWKACAKQGIDPRYHDCNGGRRLHSYCVKTCNSCFSQQCTRRLYDIHVTGLAPLLFPDTQALCVDFHPIRYRGNSEVMENY
jgi:hypothetical protein